MLAKYFSIIRNYVLSVSSKRKYNFYHQNTLLYASRTNSRNIIDRNPSMVIPLLANQDLTPMLPGLATQINVQKVYLISHSTSNRLKYTCIAVRWMHYKYLCYCLRWVIDSRKIIIWKGDSIIVICALWSNRAKGIKSFACNIPSM